MSNTTPEQQPVAIIRSIGGLVFDAVFSETHQADLEVTDNPVETGVVVSDHAYMKPLTVTLSCGVSDTPLSGWGSGYTQDSGVVQGNGDGPEFWSRSAPQDTFASNAGRAKRAFELLTELQKKAEPFDVQTGLKLYKSMVCTNIKTMQDKDSANSLVFDATLREVLVVSTQMVKYSLAKKPKKGATQRQAVAKKHKGEQQCKKVSVQQTQQLTPQQMEAHVIKRSSFLEKGIELSGGSGQGVVNFFKGL
jgi:hypothetical protein